MENSVFNNRYSCRNYTPEPVGDDALLRILEAARLAPSACNRQPWTFVVLRTPEERAKALPAYQSKAFLAEAPVIIVAVGHHDAAWHRAADGKDSTNIDVAIAVEHICLAATAEGLATCWICNFDAPLLSQSLGLGPDAEPIAIISLGHPAGTPAPKNRKPLDEIVRWGSY